jgi:hypothetical protein
MLITIIGFPVFSVPSEEAESAAQEMQRCTYCMQVLSGTSRLSHVGRHLLRLKHGIADEEEEEGEPVRDHISVIYTSANVVQMASENACGFCGRSDNPLCEQLMLKEPAGRGATKILSSCPYFYSARYGSSAKYSAARPSTNVPVVCKLCHPDSSRDFRKPCPAIWKYEMEAHVRRAHPGFATPGNPHGKLIPHDMALALNLDPREEERLGVPVSTPWTSLGNYDLPPAS